MSEYASRGPGHTVSSARSSSVYTETRAEPQRDFVKLETWRKSSGPERSAPQPPQHAVTRGEPNESGRLLAREASASTPTVRPATSEVPAPVLAPVPTIDTEMLRTLEGSDRDLASHLPSLLATLDGTTRRSLARRLDDYRPGNGDELAARFQRLDHGTKTELLEQIRGVGRSTPLLQSAMTPQVANANTSAQAVAPFGHGSHEIKIEFGEGSVTGGFTLTLEAGKTGVPLGAGELKALESTSSVKLNGLVGRLETAILTGEVDVEVFEGLKVSIEANAMSAGVDAEGAEMDLLTVSLKIIGDGGTLLNVPPGMTLAIDGRISIALGGKLAAKLTGFAVAQAEQRALARQIGTIGDKIESHAKKIKDLEARAALLRSQGGARRAEEEISDAIFKHRLQISTGNQQLKGLTGKLAAAKQKANKAIAKLQGKVVQQVARAMEKKAIKFVATKLMKLVPVLNLVSTIFDVVELIGVFKNLLSGEFGGEGGGSDGDKKQEGGESGGATASENSKGVGDSNGTEPVTDDTSGQEDAARDRASPAARSILDAITTKGRPGPQLNDDQIKMLELIVPQLTSEELADVLAQLRGGGPYARNGEDLIEAIDRAVRTVRNRARTVTVNGVSHPTVGKEGDAEEQKVQRSIGESGPVTSPSELDAPVTALEIVQHGDPAVIGRWFRQDGETLVLTDEGARWKEANLKTQLDPATKLVAVTHSVARSADGEWEIGVLFKLRVAGEERRVVHSFFVKRGGHDDGFGAKVGALKFEKFLMIDSAQR